MRNKRERKETERTEKLEDGAEKSIKGKSGLDRIVTGMS